MAMEQSSIRLETRQITALRAAAERERKATGRRCAWTELVRDAVELFITNHSKKNGRGRK